MVKKEEVRGSANQKEVRHVPNQKRSSNKLGDRGREIVICNIGTKSLRERKEFISKDQLEKRPCAGRWRSSGGTGGFSPMIASVRGRSKKRSQGKKCLKRRENAKFHNTGGGKRERKDGELLEALGVPKNFFGSD